MFPCGRRESMKRGIGMKKVLIMEDEVNIRSFVVIT